MIFIFAECCIFVIGLIALACSDGQSSNPKPRQPEIKVDVHVDTPPQKPQNPTIAEQFDGRLTNIVKNPLEGIL